MAPKVQSSLQIMHLPVRTFVLVHEAALHRCRCHESISDTANICSLRHQLNAVRPDTFELFQMHTLINKKLALAVRISDCSAAVSTTAMAYAEARARIFGTESGNGAAASNGSSGGSNATVITVTTLEVRVSHVHLDSRPYKLAESKLVVLILDNSNFEWCCYNIKYWPHSATSLVSNWTWYKRYSNSSVITYPGSSASSSSITNVRNGASPAYCNATNSNSYSSNSNNRPGGLQQQNSRKQSGRGNPQQSTQQQLQRGDRHAYIYLHVEHCAAPVRRITYLTYRSRTSCMRACDIELQATQRDSAYTSLNVLRIFKLYQKRHHNVMPRVPPLIPDNSDTTNTNSSSNTTANDSTYSPEIDSNQHANKGRQSSGKMVAHAGEWLKDGKLSSTTCCAVAATCYRIRVLSRLNVVIAVTVPCLFLSYTSALRSG
eukprot:16557-Heterococcus_DN1.PRE.2